MTKLILNGKTYTWIDGWHDEHYQVPANAVVQSLNRIAEGPLMQEDEAISDPQVLLDLAKVARDWEQGHRAIRLAARVAESGYGPHGTAAVLCSVLRRFQRAYPDCDQGH